MHPAGATSSLKRDLGCSLSYTGAMPDEDTLNQQVGVLVRREIEARIVKPFYAAVAEELGEAKAQEMFQEVVQALATESGRAMRDVVKEGDLLSFAAQWEPWVRGGALEIDELERTPQSWRFRVTRCRYAELYRRLGMEELGVKLSCARDAALIEGFDERTKLRRTQTIMEGASYCDFHYRREEGEQG